MGAIIRQLTMEIKNIFGGALSATWNNYFGVLPDLPQLSFLTETVNIAGFAVPTFLIYLVFFSD